MTWSCLQWGCHVWGWKDQSEGWQNFLYRFPWLTGIVLLTSDKDGLQDPHGQLQGGPKNRTCLSIDNSAMVTRRKACDMSKVLECCRQKGPNLHSKSFKYFLPNFPKSLLPLKLGICLHFHVPEFIELKNSLPKSPNLNSVKLFSVGALQQIAWSQNLSNWPAKTCANRMLGSADPEHIDSSDQSAA